MPFRPLSELTQRHLTHIDASNAKPRRPYSKKNITRFTLFNTTVMYIWTLHWPRYFQQSQQPTMQDKTDTDAGESEKPNYRSCDKIFSRVPHCADRVKRVSPASQFVQFGDRVRQTTRQRAEISHHARYSSGERGDMTSRVKICASG